MSWPSVERKSWCWCDLQWEMCCNRQRISHAEASSSTNTGSAAEELTYKNIVERTEFLCLRTTVLCLSFRFRNCWLIFLYLCCWGFFPPFKCVCVYAFHCSVFSPILSPHSKVSQRVWLKSQCKLCARGDSSSFISSSPVLSWSCDLSLPKHYNRLSSYP